MGERRALVGAPTQVKGEAGIETGVEMSEQSQIDNQINKKIIAEAQKNDVNTVALTITERINLGVNIDSGPDINK